MTTAAYTGRQRHDPVSLPLAQQPAEVGELSQELVPSGTAVHRHHP
ncbi:hypothetical protein AB0H57_06395 [Micromonospora sp. NPDC050686]